MDKAVRATVHTSAHRLVLKFPGSLSRVLPCALPLLTERRRAHWTAGSSSTGGLIDAAAALEHMTGKPVLTALGPANRYHQRVFLAPPWPEIYETDPERRHGLDVALAEYSRLLETYPSLGYEVLILPKVGVSERADFILNTLET